jgi:thiol:disulfide interchange protein DsbD
MKKLLLTLILLMPFAVRAADPLPPDQVYSPTIISQAGLITIHWEILPGYYLYKSKFQFVSHNPTVTLGTAVLPKGEVKEDKFFGKQEIYRNAVSVDIPYSGAGGKTDLEAVFQGCADIGFCYPPQHKHFSLTLGAATDPAPAKDASAVKPPDLQSLLSDGNDKQFLPVDQAFRFIATVKDADTLELRWQIAPGYYLYRQKFDLKSDDPAVVLGQPDFPQGKIKNDAYFGTSEIYTEDIDVLVPVSKTGEVGSFNLSAGYQGCAEKGICYPPVTKLVALNLAGASLVPGPAEAAPVAEQDRLAQLIKSGNLGLVFLAFIGLGLLLCFTPCVLPMIPIISGLIVEQGKQINTLRAFFLSLTYVLAMAFSYMVLGVVVALAGANLQALFQNPWVLSVFSLIFVALALSMFGFYELQMPSAMQSWLTRWSNAQQSGAFVGVGIMGALSALICGPCITAPLVAALVVIGETGSPLRGGLALFALGLGMGIPLLVVGTSAGKLIPKAGQWMNTVKHVFGVIMLGVAIWFLARILPGPVTLALWATLSIVTGVYLGALDAVPHGWKRLWKGLGVIALLYGLILLVGAALGGDDPLRPLARFSSGNVSNGTTPSATAASVSALPFKRIKSVDDLQRELDAASAAHKPVMLDFAADWCVSCKEMDRDTYSDSGVQAALKDAVLLQADVTANDATDQALLKHFGIYGPPSIMFFGANGQELTAYRVVGYMAPKDFLPRIRAAFNN